MVAAALAVPVGTTTQVDAPGGVYARISPTEVVLGNTAVERRWSRASAVTTALADKRPGGRTWTQGTPDFRLQLLGLDLVSSAGFRVAAARAAQMPGGGLRLTMDLQPVLAPPGLAVTRTVELRPGIAGMRSQTTLRPALGLVLGGATLEELRTGHTATTLHALRAGADWREPGWTGPDLKIGDPHAGTWRDTRRAARGAPVAAAGQWLSAADGARSAVLVAEANDQPSVRVAHDGSTASVRLEYARDVILLGPFEEQAHVENPTDLPVGRVRTVRPGGTLALPAVFTGVARDPADEAWQVHRHLQAQGSGSFRREVVFNSNGTDDDVISTGAKDDMDLATVQEVAPRARRLGVETFVLDDGWQARSGDWEPDSPAHREPRGTPPRFPDDRFDAVRQAIAPMRLGLWMSPLHFHPSSRAVREHPGWVCAPLGHALALVNALDPDSGSNEAGIGQFGAAALPHVERRIREAITEWGVSYFKFDFLAWLDCLGQGDLYALHDAFVAMLDRLRADHPHVTFQIDETNDYRLFPYESVLRGPSWFQNGSPDVPRLLHNLWNLSPYVPAATLGQHVLGAKGWEDHPVGTLMAAALPSHITVFSDLREIPDEVLDAAAPWTAWYRAHHRLLDGVTLPLLEDPLARRWTALQSWDPDAGRGALLAFRQDDARDAVRVALQGVPPNRTFDVRAIPSEQHVATVTSAQLSAGLEVHAAPRGAVALAIRPQGETTP